MHATILLMTYNQQEFVGDAVVSIIEQRCHPINILISDDASDDETNNIITEKLKYYDGPHNVIHRKNEYNLGFINHFNLATSLIQSPIIIYSAGDDISTPNRARKILSEFELNNPLLIHSDCSIINNSGESIPPYYRSAYELQEILKSPILAATSMSLHIGATAAFKKELLDNFPPINKYCFEDQIIGFRASLLKKVSYIPEPLVKYRVGNGLSQKNERGLGRASWRNFRKLILNREIHVLQQRLIDCELLPNNKSKEISGILKSSIYIKKFKFDAVDLNIFNYIFKYWKSPIKSLRFLISEQIRMNKMSIKSRSK